ncbi:hypothetical protein RFI_07337, partial [Reticulomyxa filosa]
MIQWMIMYATNAGIRRMTKEELSKHNRWLHTIDRHYYALFAEAKESKEQSEARQQRSSGISKSTAEERVRESIDVLLDMFQYTHYYYWSYKRLYEVLSKNVLSSSSSSSSLSSLSSSSSSLSNVGTMATFLHDLHVDQVYLHLYQISLYDLGDVDLSFRIMTHWLSHGFHIHFLSEHHMLGASSFGQRYLVTHENADDATSEHNREREHEHDHELLLFGQEDRVRKTCAANVISKLRWLRFGDRPEYLLRTMYITSMFHLLSTRPRTWSKCIGQRPYILPYFEQDNSTTSSPNVTATDATALLVLWTHLQQPTIQPSE